jgi:hypothetical protein
MRVTDDRAADFFADLPGQGIYDGLGAVPASAGQNVRAVVVEREDRTAGTGEDRARRHDELERRLAIRQKAREEEWGHSPDDVPGRDRS